MEQYSKNIRQLREQTGLSVDELAKMLDVYSITVGKWENGEEQPTEEQYKKLEVILKRNSAEIKETNMQLENGKVYSSRNASAKVGNLEKIVAGAIWLSAVIVFAVLLCLGVPRSWVALLYGIPASCLGLIILYVIYKFSLGSVRIVGSLSALIWSLALALFIHCIQLPHMWIVFLAAIPLQVLVVALTKIKR